MYISNSIMRLNITNNNSEQQLEKILQTYDKNAACKITTMISIMLAAREQLFPRTTFLQSN